jgi:hypothetical protein
VLFLATIVFAFSEHDGPAAFAGLYQDPNLRAQGRASVASARTAASIISWLPMVFFLFFGAQVYSTRGGVPLETISLLLRRRWKKARKAGIQMPPSRTVDISWVYFALCLFGSSIQNSERSSFFWGLSALLTWALWAQRSRRYSPVTWATVLLVALSLAYVGQFGFGRLQRYLENINPQWFSSMARRGSDATYTRTALGQVGRLKLSDSIVLRLETENGEDPPELLRETSYRSFKVQAWYAGLTRNDFEPVQPETNTTSFTLVHKINPMSVQISSFLYRGHDLLPLPEGTGRLDDLQAYVLQKNPLGAVLAEGPGMVIFKARYGPGLTLDAPPDTDLDMEIPEREFPAIQQIVNELKLESMPVKERLKTIEDFFAQKFEYSTWQPEVEGRDNVTPLTRFLLQTRKGHCEYFATAAALLCRGAGIPARYAVGFAVHEGKNGKYVVRQHDSHAWTLVWNEARQKWQNLDTTPPDWLAAETGKPSILRALKDAWSRAWYEFSKLRWGQTPLRTYILYALIPVLLLLLYQIIFRKRKRAGDKKSIKDAAMSWPGQDSEFYQLEKKIASRGLPRGEHEAVADWVRRIIGDPAINGAAEPLRELLQLHYRYRFDPNGLSPEDRQQLRQQATRALARMQA